MKRVRLGKTDMYVNAIGLGCMGLTHASGLPTSKEEAVEIACKMEHIVPEHIFNNMVKLTDFVTKEISDKIKNLY